LEIVHELLRNLPQGALVLDLGCGAGSFDSDSGQFTVVRIDLERGAFRAPNFAQADAATLPFAANCFDVVISNHSLEHFENLAGSLEEIGRVLKPSGALYVAAPDATTISDRLYRWLARGGGHVNPFRSARELAWKIESKTGLRHVATRTLCASLSFLNRRNRRAPPPKRLLLVGGGTETSLLLLSYFFRMFDRFLGSRTSVYGWALFFGRIDASIDCQTWTNVCIRCGSGHPSDWLLHGRKLVRKILFFSTYRCPHCGAINLFTDDKRYPHFGNTTFSKPEKHAGAQGVA
jgi:SAM-dependent methyltransferase